MEAVDVIDPLEETLTETMDVAGPLEETLMEMVDTINPLEEAPMEMVDAPRDSLPVPSSTSSPWPMH